MSTQHREVSVIGLGEMGLTLAQLLLREGYRVTVWNRTESKAQPLLAEGATLAASPAEAIAASPVTVVCVYDYAATKEILGGEQVAEAVRGRTLIQLTTGSPQEAREGEAWARGRGARYLDGAIQAAPSQMAQPDTVILISGEDVVFRDHEGLLKVFGGNVKYLGEQVGSASAMDAATLSSLYGSLLGFFHGARISQAEGFDVNAYAGIVAEIIPTFGDFLKHEAKVIQSGDFTATESPLRISVEATARLVRMAGEAGINAEFPAFAAGLLRKADAAGYRDEELAAVVKVLS